MTKAADLPDRGTVKAGRAKAAAIVLIFLLWVLVARVAFGFLQDPTVRSVAKGLPSVATAMEQSSATPTPAPSNAP